MAIMIQGYTCPGCGRFHKYPQGFEALGVGLDRNEDGLMLVAVRKVGCANGQHFHVVEHYIKLAEADVT